jgi:hypothetical protein
MCLECLTERQSLPGRTHASAEGSSGCHGPFESSSAFFLDSYSKIYKQLNVVLFVRFSAAD